MLLNTTTKALDIFSAGFGRCMFVYGPETARIAYCKLGRPLQVGMFCVRKIKFERRKESTTNVLAVAGLQTHESWHNLTTPCSVAMLKRGA